MAIRTKHKVNPNFSMSGMTDIVFLLLIFFMITSTLVTTSAFKVNLPEADGKRPNTNGVIVTINENMEYFVNDTQVGEANLESAIKQAMTANDQSSIQLNADGSVNLNEAVRVMEIAYRNKYEIVLLTTPK